MSDRRSPARSSDCPGFTSASITLVLDATGAETTAATWHMPNNFRSCLDPLPSLPQPPSQEGLKEICASGGAQYSQEQLAAMLASGHVTTFTGLAR